MQFNMKRTVAFSGHRNEKMPQTQEGLEKLVVRLRSEIDMATSEGYDTFLFGGCRGFDLFAAQRVLYRKQIHKPTDPPKLTLVAVLPFEGQADRWRGSDREQYFDMLPQCDEVVTLQAHFSPDCYRRRNELMVQQASRLICYHDGSKGGTDNTVRYAVEQGLTIRNLYNP